MFDLLKNIRQFDLIFDLFKTLKVSLGYQISYVFKVWIIYNILPCDYCEIKSKPLLKFVQYGIKTLFQEIFFYDFHEKHSFLLKFLKKYNLRHPYRLF